MPALKTIDLPNGCILVGYVIEQYSYDIVREQLPLTNDASEEMIRQAVFRYAAAQDCWQLRREIQRVPCHVIDLESVTCGHTDPGRLPGCWYYEHAEDEVC